MNFNRCQFDLIRLKCIQIVQFKSEYVCIRVVMCVYYVCDIRVHEIMPRPSYINPMKQLS